MTFALYTRPYLSYAVRETATWLVLSTALLGGGCKRQGQTDAQATQRQTNTSATSGQTKTPPNQDQQGTASWYGHPFDGRLTANGQVYDMEGRTAAHLTLPFGTRLLVERMDTHAKVEVTVNDRGPYVKDRIIDLSHGAAQSIDMPGISTVALHVLFKPRTRGPESYAVQVGDYPNKAAAEAIRDRLKPSFSPVALVYREADTSWRVLVGAVPSIEAANALALQLAPTSDTTFVVLVDPD